MISLNKSSLTKRWLCYGESRKCKRTERGQCILFLFLMSEWLYKILGNHQKSIIFWWFKFSKVILGDFLLQWMSGDFQIISNPRDGMCFLFDLGSTWFYGCLALLKIVNKPEKCNLFETWQPTWQSRALDPSPKQRQKNVDPLSRWKNLSGAKRHFPEKIWTSFWIGIKDAGQLLTSSKWQKAMVFSGFGFLCSCPSWQSHLELSCNC